MFDYISSGPPTIPAPAAPANLLDVANGVGYVSTGKGNGWQAGGNRPAVNALTAFAGGGQGSATALTSGAINRVTTVASANDSVKLPAATPGLTVIVINAAAANSMNVFPSTGDAINALSANAAFAMAANKTAYFFCAVAGTWNSILTA